MDEVRLGIKLNHAGKNGRAARAWGRAINSGDPEAAPKAAFELGLLRRDEGRLVDAILILKIAAESGHPTLAPFATSSLAEVLARCGDYADAAEVYESLIAAGGDRGAWALLKLGEMRYYDEKKPDLAEPLYQRAVDTGHEDVAPMAMSQLGVLCENRGDLAAAETWYQRAIDADHLEASPEARRCLRVLRARQGELVEHESLPRTRPAEGVPDTQCLVLLDRDGRAYGLWFEDMSVGDRICRDSVQLRDVLRANRLAPLWERAFQSGPAGDGGYEITFFVT